MSNEIQQFDFAIIGAGPAGLSAAIYAARGQLKTVFFGDQTKSNLYKSHVIANYFGFPSSPTGPELTKLGMEQAQNFGAIHVPNQIVDLQIQADQTFLLKDNLQNLYQAKAVLLATGQSYVLSGIKGEQELTGKGVSYCVTCDGFFYKNKAVTIIGNGDYAAEEALQLLPYTKDITILSHGKEFTFGPTFQKELEHAGIKTINTGRLSSIESSGTKMKVTSLQPFKHQEKELNFWETDGFFMAIGIAGANAFAKKLGLEMEGNYIKADKDGQTNLPGLFAAGDCTGAPPQVASSVGSGCNAALSAIKSIRGLNVYIQYN